MNLSARQKGKNWKSSACAHSRKPVNPIAGISLVKSNPSLRFVSLKQQSAMAKKIVKMQILAALCWRWEFQLMCVKSPHNSKLLHWRSFLPRYRDPSTKSRLTLEVEKGEGRSSSETIKHHHEPLSEAVRSAIRLLSSPLCACVAFQSERETQPNFAAGARRVPGSFAVYVVSGAMHVNRFLFKMYAMR